MENVLNPLIGGLLIGLSSSLLLGGIGRIAGISGILGSSLAKFHVDNLWKYYFLFGLILGGFFMYVVYPQMFHYKISFSESKLIIAGLLVGYGTRLGSGCTSGHGVCGVARMAKRSFVATLTFILFGILTVAVQGALS